MMKRLAKTLVLGAVVLAPLAAVAEDAALILVGSDYQRLPDPGGANPAAALAQVLEAAGFTVSAALDQDVVGATRAMEDFRADAADAERVFVLMAGHIVSTPRDSWLLTRYAEAPTDITVGGEAVPIGPVLDIAAAHPGQAAVLLAPADNDVGGTGLAPGVAVTAPQGVTLFTGPTDRLVQLARDTLLVPGRPLGSLPRGVEVSGFVSDAVPFSPAPSGGPGLPPPTTDHEAAFWDVVKAMGSVAAFEAYLDVYPVGRFAPLARAAIQELEFDADTRAEAVEAALGLDRDTRRDIQRDLSLLGYDPRGIDGIFGPGSRAAITAWQRAGGYPATGYLTADQIRALSDAAAVRAAELEREAAARKAEEERLDTLYWRETGRGGDEAGLRAYLARYPDGLFSDIAELRLAEIEEAKRAEAAAEERAFWDEVRAADDEASYRRYLRRYPEGTFAEEAQARLDELTEEDEHAAAKAEEEHVAGNGVTRLLVENRLSAAGYDPGPIDGTFDKKTRRAIRKFQRAAGIEVSGYVTQATMVRLLLVH
jgi:peptidoglycan hydrolase-like protein with peptidoglycan-binding domain